MSRLAGGGAILAEIVTHTLSRLRGRGAARHAMRGFALRVPGSAWALAALALPLLLTPAAQAAEDCLLVTELKSAQVVAKQGLCASRHSPASTFKIALALMGYDSGILKSETAPVFTTEPGLAVGEGAQKETWAGPQTPQSWMKNSVVWYSQVLTRKLGAEKLAGYVKGFAYGNENLSGDPGKDNGLIRAWLSSSLQISPREQVDFLRKMLKGELPVSAEAVDKTIALLKAPEEPAGYLLYGKTGSGFLQLNDGSLDRTRPFGWFVGWAEKGGRTFVFTRFMSLDFAVDESLGLRARRQALMALEPVLQAQAR